MKTLRQFIEENRIRCDVYWADSNPNMDDGAHPMNHWRVTLKMGRKRLTVPFSTGIGWARTRPDVADVLDCLASDAAGSENARSFEDWCGEYGYDADSRKAEHTYRACERQSIQLKRFLGAEAYDVLLWHTERL